MTLPEILHALADGKPVQHRYPRDEQWHDNDTNSNLLMLATDETFEPDRWRLKPEPEPVPPGELTHDEAQALFDQGEMVQVQYESGMWADVLLASGPKGWAKGSRKFRRKPAPEPVPLGPEDVPPGSCVRKLKRTEGSAHWVAVETAYDRDVYVHGHGITGYENLRHEWEISRDGGKTWQRAEKEAK